MELAEPKGIELEQLRAEDPEGTAWIDELPNIRTLGELLRLFDLHGKKVRFVSIKLRPREQSLSDTGTEEPG